MRTVGYFMSVAVLALVQSVCTAGEFQNIKDDGKFFSPEAVQKAEAQLQQLRKNKQQSLTIETYAAIPESRTGFEAAKKEEFFSAWAKERFAANKQKGPLVLICKDPSYLYVLEGKLSKDDRTQLTQLMLQNFKKKEYDQALVAAAEFAGTRLANAIPVEAGSNPQSAEAAPVKSSSSTLGTIVVIAVAVLGFLLVLALFRSMAGGGMGGGGGGFFSGLMGGIAGAMMGSWLYNSFAGGSDPSASGDSNSSDSSFDSDQSTDGGGGDFGGDAGGGDF